MAILGIMEQVMTGVTPGREEAYSLLQKYNKISKEESSWQDP